MIRIFLLTLLCTAFLIGKGIEVSKMEVADSKKYYGALSADDSKVYSLSIRVDGFIEKLFVSKNYTFVKKGEPLFSLYSPELVDAQSELLATQGYNQGQLARQKLELLGVDKAQIDKIARTHRIINELIFYAPSDGFVIKNVNVGSGVKKGDEVFRITNIDSLWLIANINQEDLEILQKNGRAFARIDGISGDIMLKFDMIYPEVNDNFVKVRFMVENKNRALFPNMFANVIIEGQKRDALVLPKSAVLQKNGKFIVFVDEDDEMMPQEIEARRILGSDYYEILSGLQQGDMVERNASFILDADAQNNGLFD